MTKRAKQTGAIAPAAAPQLPTSIPQALTGLPAMIAAQLAALSPRGPTVPVAVVKAPKKPNEYELADGTVLRVRLEIQNVQQEQGRYNASGQPVYHFNVALNVTVDAPPHLMQGYKPRRKRKKK